MDRSNFRVINYLLSFQFASHFHRSMDNNDDDDDDDNDTKLFSNQIKTKTKDWSRISAETELKKHQMDGFSFLSLLMGRKMLRCALIS